MLNAAIPLKAAALALVLAVADTSGCASNSDTSNTISDHQLTQVDKTRATYDSIRIEKNGELSNIKRYVEETTKPGMLGYVMLFTLGRPIAYYTVSGPVTDCARELTPMLHPISQYTSSSSVVDSPNDEGTYGGNEHCHFFYTTDDRLIRWSGEFLYSDNPIRIDEKPLVIQESKGF